MMMSREDREQKVTASGRVETPLGILEVAWEGECLLRLDLLYAPDITAAAVAPAPDRGRDEERGSASPLPAAIRAALARYFHDGRAGLDLPLAPAGTPFQCRVWQALRDIPPGTTRTYGELARELGTSPRAIGGACRANPCLIAVPCHRVVARDGLGGFAGERGGKRLAVKRWLLRHEGAVAGGMP
jgi:methylated-DNA-[protein]-cysteine S-methyltransferase